MGLDLPEVEEFYIDDPNDVIDDSPLEVADDLKTPEELNPKEPEAEESTEAEASEEAEPEAEEDATAEEAEEAEPEPETDGPKPGTPDKYVQQLQQRQATTERQLSQITESLQALTQAIQSGQQTPQKPADEPEAPQQDDAVEKAIAELEAFTADQGDDLDELSKADLAKYNRLQANVLRAMHKSKAQPTKIEGLDQIQKLTEYVETLQLREQADKGWKQFEEKHGFDGRDLWTDSLSAAAERYPDDPDKQRAAAEIYFEQKVEAKSAEQKKPDKPRQPAPDPEKTKPAPKKATVPPPSSKPRTSTTGTQTTPPGATGAGQVKTQKGLPPVWDPRR